MLQSNIARTCGVANNYILSRLHAFPYQSRCFPSFPPREDLARRQMLQLGLARIGRLLADTPLSWRAIHVAGTNGKGSVCAYVSSMLHAVEVPCGRFTSPHLLDRWDCITINERTVDKNVFHEVEKRVKDRDSRENIGASEFELLTATAFEVFEREKVEIAVVEVGMGGRLDATNVLEDVLVSVITKIGKDHENYLGKTLKDIAYQKAGILKPGVASFVDSTNSPEVLQVLSAYAEEIHAGPLVAVPEPKHKIGLWDYIDKKDYLPHQQVNITLAYKAVTLALTNSINSSNSELPGHGTLASEIELLKLACADAVINTVWPGRLQRERISLITRRIEEILVDGAHNPQSAEVLGSSVDKLLRCATQPVTWVVGVSEGKDLKSMIPAFVRPKDNVVTVEFGPVEGMPWVKPMKAEDILSKIGSWITLGNSESASGDVRRALQAATDLSKGGPLVVAGSLYLVSDVYRLLRTAERDLRTSSSSEM